MKLADNEFPNLLNEISVSKVTIEYVQDLDCCQSEKDYPEGVQILTVTTDDGGGGNARTKVIIKCPIHGDFL